MPHGRRHTTKRIHRRFKRRVSLAIGGCVLLALIVAGVSYLAHLEYWNIQAVSVSGTEVIDADDVQAEARDLLTKKYLWLFPYSNAALYPRSALKEHLAQTFPRIQTTRVDLQGLTKLSVSVTEREPFALLCPSRETDQRCRYVDQRGVVYAHAPDFSGSVYVTFRDSATSTPVGKQYKPETFPRIAQLLNDLQVVDVKPITVTPEKQQDYTIALENGGELRVTLQQDIDETLQNLRVLFNNEKLDLAAKQDGNTFRYIDLRFGDRVFFKYASSTAATST